MIKEYSNKNFNIKDTLTCGQTFRFRLYREGYVVFSLNNACYIYEKNSKIYIESENLEYFENYFDLKTDYSKIVEKAKSYNIEYLTLACEYGKGIRILRQNNFEMIISFIISQNNNIPRIKGIIEKLCEKLGCEYTFLNEKCYTFPKIEDLQKKDIEFFKEIGLGYRAEYIKIAVNFFTKEEVERLKTLPTEVLQKELLSVKGIGLKVASCITLFGFNRFDSFPVDVWIDKLYRENLNGNLTDRNKISNYLVEMFGEYSGYIQQYLFYYKREK